MGYRIAAIKGDGIGPEILEAVILVLEELADRFSLQLEVRELEAGDKCLKDKGVALPPETLNTIKLSDACLKAPVGETAADVIVKLRQIFDLYANLRPVKAYPQVPCLFPDVDLLIVRENTEGLYKGFEFDLPGAAIALRIITEKASRRIAEYAFRMAEERGLKGGDKRPSVIAVHKANVLRRSDGLFAKVCREVAQEHPSVSYSEMYVDAAAMNLIRRPQDFDVIVTTNLYGDILSDEAAQLVGGLGMVPSANIGDEKALFEPVHGSAPDIAGKGIANPVAMLLSSKMMLEWLSFKHGDARLLEAAGALEEAIFQGLRSAKTPDLGGSSTTNEVALAIAQALKH